MTRLVKHYTHDVMYALLHLVGSLDVLGNPLGLVTNLSQGVTGFMDHTGSGIRDLRQGHLSAMGKDLALGAAVRVERSLPMLLVLHPRPEKESPSGQV